MDEAKIIYSDSLKNNRLAISSLMPKELWQISIGFLPHTILQGAEDQKTGLQELRYVCRTFKQLAEQDPRWRLVKHVQLHGLNSALPVGLVCDQTLLALFKSVACKHHLTKVQLLNLTGSKNFGTQALSELPEKVCSVVLRDCLQLKPDALSAIQISKTINQLDLQGLHLTEVWARKLLQTKSTDQLQLGIKITGPCTRAEFLAALPSHIYGVEVSEVNSIPNATLFFKGLPAHINWLELDALTIEAAKGLTSTRLSNLRIFDQCPTSEALRSLGQTVRNLTLDLSESNLGSVLKAIPLSVTELTLCGYLDETGAHQMPSSIHHLHLVTEPQNAEVLHALGAQLQSINLLWPLVNNPFVLSAIQELRESGISIERIVLRPHP